MSNETEYSEGGSPIYRHQERNQWQTPQAEPSETCLEQISDHIERHLGPVKTVFHELISDTVHIDVHIVLPTDDSPWIRLVTSGMSDLPMQTPTESGASRYAELMMTLPAEWRLEQEQFEDENWYWPIRLIKTLARLPHQYSTWLGFGHTVPNGDPAQNYAPNTQLNGAIILPSITVPQDFHRLQIGPDKEIAFFSVVPLYEEEMNLKLKKGTDHLLDLFDQHGMSDVINPQRKNIAKKRFFFF